MNLLDPLDLLRHRCAPHPKRNQFDGRQEPFWAPNQAKDIAYLGVRIPEWNWARPDLTAETRVVEFDQNAAWLSAMSTVEIPLFELQRSKEQPFMVKRAGYWLIEPEPWTHDFLPSPLGTGRHKDQVWVCTPRVRLLQELSEVHGLYGGFKVVDSLTSERTQRLNTAKDGLSNVLRDHRVDLMDWAQMHGQDPDKTVEYRKFKELYGRLPELLISGHNAPGGIRDHRIHRPDWGHLIKDQFFTNLWRKAFQAHLAGHGPIRIHTRDVLTFTLDDAVALLDLVEAGKVPIKFDPSGRQLGAMKFTKEWKEMQR